MECQRDERIERIDEGVLWWFGHAERMKNDKIAKKVYIGECAGSQWIGCERAGLIP